jgi:predicted nuclease of predicted toxin-antitoxin system
MSKIEFLADMNISPKTVESLQQQGWNIIRVSDILPANTPDYIILEFARNNGKVIITQDLDFSTMIALSGYNYPGLITVRLLDSDPDIVTKRLLEVLPNISYNLLEGCIVTIEEINVRIRRLPI